MTFWFSKSKSLKPLSLLGPNKVTFEEPDIVDIVYKYIHYMKRTVCVYIYNKQICWSSMNGHHCIGRLFFKYHESWVLFKDDQSTYCWTKICGTWNWIKSITILYWDHHCQIRVCQIYQFLQKNRRHIPKNNTLKFQKSYLKFHTLFVL